MTHSGTARQATLLLIAKVPRPGQVKTRLCPPCTPQEAAEVAAAALLDSLTALAGTPAVRRVLVLDGPAGALDAATQAVLAAGAFDAVPQASGGLDRRLEAAFAAVGSGPALLVGMDTPQVRPGLLLAALATLAAPGVDAVLGPAEDGGWWAAGLRRPTPGAFAGVPMSVPTTFAAQRLRFDTLGLVVAELPTLRDVDDAGDAAAVARLVPGSRFAAAVENTGLAHPSSVGAGLHR